MLELPSVNNNLLLRHVKRFLKANNDYNRKKFRGLRPSTRERHGSAKGAKGLILAGPKTFAERTPKKLNFGLNLSFF